MIGNPNYTDSSVSYLATKPGQAHFAKVDTTNTCRECEHWANQRGEKDRYGNLEPARCRKALESMTDPPPVPHSAWACRFFRVANTPPTI